jgi:hypothetical protein
MNSCFEIVSGYAEEFRSIISKDSALLPVHQYPWRTDTWTNETFSRAHVQEFTSPSISVLHVTIFPHLKDPSPIYGFDVITGARKPSSCYIDLSPTVQSWDNWPSWLELDPVFPNRKEIPEWGTCFSNEFMAIALNDEVELASALGAGIELLKFYLVKLHINQMMRNTWNEDEVYRAQFSYCEQQRQNSKTTAILQRMIGEEQANYYVNHVLFPDPKD